MTLELDARAYKGVVFDMGGVLAQTADLHARAWKQVIDDFLADRPAGGGPQRPFDVAQDFRAFLRDRPRLHGLESFLESRAVYIAWGKGSDPAGADTVFGLSKSHDRLFLEMLEREGIQTFADAVMFAGQVRTAGLGSAVIASGNNGRKVIEISGLGPLFDGIVDGLVVSELSLGERPDPDVVVEASRRCGAEPGEVVLFEDTVAGVQAGKAAGVKLVVGVARAGDGERLQQAGADLVVNDLAGIRLLADRPRSSDEVGSALTASGALAAVASHVPRTAIFLDYDGTLTPIVERPDLATLDERTREVLSRLAERHTVAVISGRSLQDVRSLVGLEGLLYAGSHGLEIASPDGGHYSPDLGRDYEALMDVIEEELVGLLEGHEGVLLEKKSVSLAVHFRLAPEVEPIVSEVVDRVVSRHEGLRRQEGKKVIEVRPDVDWDKGKALGWLMDRLDLRAGRDLVLYMGDDDTDEDAFRALRGRGMSVMVRDVAVRETFADLAVEDTDEVRELLETLG